PVFGISAIVNYSGIQASPLSSPTRRSSDLEGASLVERVRWLIDSEINPQLAAHRGRVALEAVDADGVVWLRFGGGCHGCGMADVDRKSTRLNSSHVKISYAVFCLKKKKEVG